MEIGNGYARPADLRSCGVGSNPALSTKRDVGSAIGDNGGSAPRRSADHGSCGHFRLVAGGVKLTRANGRPR
jgi:hypothetical protein